MKDTGVREYRTWTWLVGTALGAAWLCVPIPASAGTLELHYAAGGSGTWVSPRYTAQHRVAAVPAVCEMRPRRIWHEPVYEVRRVLVDVPAKVVTKRVPRYDRFGRLIGYKIRRTVIRPARAVWTTQRVLVRAGFHETIYERVCAQPVSRKVLYGSVLTPPARWARPDHVKMHYPHRYRRTARPFVSHRHREHGLRWAVRLGL